MADQPPRRKFFQIQLFTAIALMFVSSAWIWANCQPRAHTVTVFRILGEVKEERMVYYGWPIPIYVSGDVSYSGIAANVLLLLFLLFVLWAIGEERLREPLWRKK